MEDENYNKIKINQKNAQQVQQNYISNGFDIANNLKAFETPSIFTISGNSLHSRVELVSSVDEDENEGDSDIISDLIGHIGTWQLFWAIIMCLYQFPTTFHIFCLVFQAATKDFWCSRPDNLQMISMEHWRNMTQPTSQCQMIDAPYDKMDAFNFTQTMLNATAAKFIKCNSWEFDMSFIGKTIVSEWNMVCDKGYLASVVESCFLAGAGLGSVSSGYISDQYGRKKTLMVFATIQLVTGTLLGFCESMEIYMVGRVIIGFASMAVVVVSFVLCVELVSGKWRTIIGIFNILPVAIAYIICAIISYLTYNWRPMQFVITSPTLFLLLLWPFVPESPRWLLSRGRLDELSEMVQKASRWNNIQLPTNFKKMIASTMEINEQESNRKVSVLDLFQKGYKLKTALMAIAWFSIILIYFGITLHMGFLGGNIYINVLIAGTVEAISIALSVFVVLKLGLRINLIIYLIVAGIACLFINYVRADNLWLTITLAMIVKIAIGASNALIPTFTANHYPVYMRNLGIGAGNLSAGFALVLVPYLFLLEKVEEHLPMSILGTVGLIGAISLLFIKDKSMTKKSASQETQINNASSI
ncbi:hypothetical protein PVAND_009292 [Polypedilum vanderplanki]|uniref:Major facilitator superfamily (MFS) profile domain-containing protein n=1 Tax=Polypedilum vanderplanki TaxID=319348 RepID=A0A9J6CD30_POLVA|nr:hypothetical protein PVAND_009292 [Polypedilum vanderplanki]